MDCGLLRSLTDRTADAPIDGHFFATYVASELVKWLKTLRSDAQLFYYRTRSGLEVDFLLQGPQGLLGIEVKHRGTVGATDIGGMKRLAAKLGKRRLVGLAVYDGEQLEELEPGYWAMPSYRLFS